MTGEILGFLQKNVVEYREHVSFRALSTVKIGGCVDVVAYPDNVEKLEALICYVRNNKIRYKILGRASNVLPRDENFHGVVIKTDRMNSLMRDKNTLIVDAGISIPRLSRVAYSFGLSGLEELSGIPGSLGGAIAGNAGAYGREIGQLVRSAALLDLDTGKFLELSKEEMQFGYRDSILKHKDLIFVSAKLDLKNSNKDNIRFAMRCFSEQRRSSQPINQPSLGSVFKRPREDLPSWRLIDGAGMRGFRIGDAMVSEKHAGFIVNVGTATAGEYISLVQIIQEKVYEKYGIKLEREFEII